MGSYPKIVVDINKFRSNVREMKKRCDQAGIGLVGVVKGFNGIPQMSKVFADEGVNYIASSRLEHLKMAKDYGVDTPMMLIRIPMLSEISKVISLTEASLNSEVEVLKALNEEAKKQDKIHHVILMSDIGDLREGFFDKKELLEAALLVENELDNLYLDGVATNVGCYGAVAATNEKLSELVADAEMIEEAIGRKLDHIGGGATTSLPRIMDGDMPSRVNYLRLGEGIILSRDMEDIWGYSMDFMNKDVFTIKAEVIEIKDKPTHPIGKIVVDAFGNRPLYEDRGIRKRALIALGKVDYGDDGAIFPREEGIEVVGASSDHTILDIEDYEGQLKVGDILEFDVIYVAMVYMTNSSNVEVEFVQ